MNTIIMNCSDVVDELELIAGYVKRTTGVRRTSNQRVFREAVELIVRGVLDERIFNIFSTMESNWDEVVFDLLFSYELTPEEINRILNSTEYRRVLAAIKAAVNTAILGNDHNFTMWDVTVDAGLNSIIIKNLGDYRIMQWHAEHNVAVTITDNLTVDIGHYLNYLNRVTNIGNAPSMINGAPRAEVLNDVVLCSIMAFISETKEDYFTLDRLLQALFKQHLIDSVEVTREKLNGYFNLEVKSALEKTLGFNTIRSFTLDGDTMVIQTQPSQSKPIQDYNYLELKLEENRGDYIPEKFRKTRG